MEENVYAPPKSALTDVSSINGSLEVRFFPVSSFKLVVLSTCTLGIYQIFWFYKNWILIKRHSEPDILPWARAVFGFFWCYGCFEFIRNDERQLGIEPQLTAGPLAVAWITASLGWRMPYPYALIGFLAPLLLVPAQRHINRINTMVAPDHDTNSRFTASNWLAVVAIALFIALIVFDVSRRHLVLDLPASQSPRL